MKKSIPYVLLLLLVLILHNCSVDDDSPSDGPTTSATEGLQGSWTWVESTGSIAGVTITPASSGKTMQVEFTTKAVFNKFVMEKMCIPPPTLFRKKIVL